MPRDSGGTYTLPLAPVVAGTPIEATWANTSLDDVAVALTDSLSRSGSGGMQAALKLVDGVVGTPGVNFNSEPSSGWYRAATFDVRSSIAGVDLLRQYQDGGGNRFFQFWDGTQWQNILYETGPGALDTDGLLPNALSLVFDGFGVQTVTRPATGVIRFVFDNAAGGTFKQNVKCSQLSPNANDVYVTHVQYIDASTVDVHCYFVNTATGVYSKQDNNGYVTLKRTLIE